MSDRDYCYPPDYTVLRNRLNIRAAPTLEAAERQLCRPSVLPFPCLTAVSSVSVTVPPRSRPRRLAARVHVHVERGLASGVAASRLPLNYRVASTVGSALLSASSPSLSRAFSV